MQALFLALALCLALPAHSESAMTIRDIQSRPHAEIEAQLPAAHPALYYSYATRLMREDRKDEAVFWFYAGQLRFRFHLAANPSLPRDRDPALMASLNDTVGREVNGYAGGDPERWAAQIGKVLQWDAATPNGYTSKTTHASQWKEIRAGLESLRDSIAANAADFRSQRRKNGLENR